MIIDNRTEHDLGFLHRFVDGHDVQGLRVKVATTKRGAKCPYSGRFYGRKAYIRVSINLDNRYPLDVTIGSPFNRATWKRFTMNSVKELISFVFLHEFSHFLDHQQGLPLGCKQTKADTFALRRMGKL